MMGARTSTIRVIHSANYLTDRHPQCVSLRHGPEALYRSAEFKFRETILLEGSLKKILSKSLKYCIK